MAGWTMHRSVLVVVAFAAALLAAAAVGAASPETSTETHCSVPCGYIYPLIIIEPDQSQDTLTLPEDGSKVEVPATFVWTFDIANEGFTVNNPTEPIEVTFEFPRKPSWAGMEVEPSKFTVPISPQYVEPEADDPTNPGAQYRYTTDVTVKMWQKEQATLRPGEETADLLVFAKSSESGLYKPSYGIKEFTVDPEGAVVEAAEDQTVDAPEVPSFDVPDATRGLGPVDVELTAEGSSGVFEPTAVQARVTGDDGGVSSVQNLALVDEDGTLLYATGPRTADAGTLSANLTFPEPGSYRILVTAEPGPGTGTTWTPGTVAFPVEVPGTENEAVQLSNQYTARYHEKVSEAHADPGDPSSQYEKSIPLPVYDGANGANLLFELATDNPAAATPSGPANLNVQLLGPNGGVVARGTFDPANPTLRMPVNALPGEGLYQIRVFGQGADAEALAGASYDVQVSASYDGPPVVDDVHDGQLAAPGQVAHGPVAVETDHTHHDPWTPQEVSVPVTAAGNGSLDGEAALTILDPQGRQVLSTGWQDASDGTVSADVTFPGLGRYVAAVHVRTSPGNGTHTQPTTLASTLHVGDHQSSTVTLPDTYRAEQTIEVPPGHGPDDPYRRTIPVDVRDGFSSLEAAATVEGGDPGETYRLSVVGPDGSTADQAEAGGGGELSVSVESETAGRYLLTLAAEAADGGSVDLSVEVPYATPVTAENPLVAGTAGDGSASTAGDGDLVPATPAAALAGLLGAALALRRRD